jgi:hypothetical protein
VAQVRISAALALLLKAQILEQHGVYPLGDFFDRLW